MKLYAYVLHNVGPKMFWDCDPENLHHAHTFEIEADSAAAGADLIWNLTNVGSQDELRIVFPHLAGYAPQVADYRRRENRSLSVGDAIVFMAPRSRLVATLSVATVGFNQIADLEIAHWENALNGAHNDGQVSEARKALLEFGRQFGQDSWGGRPDA